MHLTLVPQKLEVLIEAGKSVVSDLQTEIGHTDKQAMREDLQKRKEVLSGIHIRLSLPA